MKKFFLVAAIFAAAILLLGGLRLLRARRDTQKPPLPTAGAYAAGDYHEALVIDGRTRMYHFRVPQGYSAAKKYPLVAVFHGGKGTGKRAMEQTKFDAKADQEGFVAVFPDGIENSWNDGRGTAEAEKRGVDDVKFIRQLVSHLQSKLSIDRKMVYAAGVSNGGMMSYRLGCDAADIFAAIGPDVANLPEPIEGRCIPSNPIPVVAINGFADPFVPYNGGDCCGREGSIFGGQGGRVLSARKTLEIFAEANNCDNKYTVQTLPSVINDNTSVEKRTYNCPAGQEVISYVVNGMGHAWPPNPPQAPRIAGSTSQNINATDVIWDFFKTHPRP